MSKIIGITGPSGAGKSLLCKYMSDADIPCIDADEVYHSMLCPNSETLKAIAAAFGKGVISADGSLDRAALSSLVFNDEKKLALLNSTVLPLVIAEIENIISDLSDKGHRAVVVDAPTLIESGFYKKCDLVVAVIAPISSRISRIESRDHISSDRANQRAVAQNGDDFYTSVADLTIINDADEEAFERASSELIKRIQSL